MIPNKLKLLIAGEGGQGIQTIAEILFLAACNQGLYSTYIPNFGVEQRGGASLAFVQIAHHPIDYPKFKEADLIVLLAPRVKKRITLYVGNKTKIIDLNSLSPTKENLPLKTFNMIVLGVIAEKLKEEIGLAIEEIERAISSKLKDKPDYRFNLIAFNRGLSISGQRKKLSDIFIRKRKSPFSLNYKKIILFPHLCKGCGNCLYICPYKALYWNWEITGVYQGPTPGLIIKKCRQCGKCSLFCPDFAILVKNR